MSICWNGYVDRHWVVPTCVMPIGDLFLSFNIHVLVTDTPILLSIADLYRNKLKYINTEDALVHVPTASHARVKRVFGHPMVTWNRYT